MSNSSSDGGGFNGDPNNDPNNEPDLNLETMALPSDAPSRSLSAYHLFYQDELNRLTNERFFPDDLLDQINFNWFHLPAERIQQYERLAQHGINNFDENYQRATNLQNPINNNSANRERRNSLGGYTESNDRFEPYHFQSNEGSAPHASHYARAPPSYENNEEDHIDNHHTNPKLTQRAFKSDNEYGDNSNTGDIHPPNRVNSSRDFARYNACNNPPPNLNSYRDNYNNSNNSDDIPPSNSNLNHDNDNNNNRNDDLYPVPYDENNNSINSDDISPSNSYLNHDDNNNSNDDRFPLPYDENFTATNPTDQFTGSAHNFFLDGLEVWSDESSFLVESGTHLSQAPFSQAPFSQAPFFCHIVVTAEGDDESISHIDVKELMEEDDDLE